MSFLDRDRDAVMSMNAALKQFFGHTSFRPGQEKLIEALLSGRDVLGVMPTGAGKSICYQIPALLHTGVTLVISPLISLMKDQVSALSQAGIPAAFINSSLNAAQCREAFRRAEKGQYKIIYIAPERLETADFLRFVKSVRVSLVAVDEAHCVSQWGQDFRPSYLKISNFIGQLPYRPAIGAFTATATAEVKKDIIRLLRLQQPLLLTTGFDRPNLNFDVVKPSSKQAFLHDYVNGCRGKSGIVYCATRKSVEAVCDALCKWGIAATRYHAGLDEKERRKNQDDFVYDRKSVIVATNAFGMGIDKSNVGFVIHYNMPKNLESYYQEAGRAGRDGEPADCILLFSNGDVQTAKYLIQNSEDNEALSKEEHEHLLRHDMGLLEKMVGYCKTNGCLRAYILEYFGEEHSGECGNCGNCMGEFIERDITTEAQKILSGVARVEKLHPYGLGVTIVVRMLHGSKEQRVIQLGLDKLPTYGILNNIDRRTIRRYIEHLISERYLELTQGEYPVLHLTTSAGDVLFRGKPVAISVRTEHVVQDKTKNRRKDHLTYSEVDSESLLSALKSLRTRLAQEANVPAYIVFSNAALSDMASKKPRTKAQFLEVSGVGEFKAERYGKVFLDAINEYLENENL